MAAACRHGKAQTMPAGAGVAHLYRREAVTNERAGSRLGFLR